MVESVDDRRGGWFEVYDSVIGHEWASLKAAMERARIHREEHMGA